MKPRRLLIQLTTLFSLVALMTTGVGAHALPPEPGEGYLVNEDINIITGLYYREYSLSKNGVVDYRTARQIVFSEYNKFFNTVVHAKTHPLFYWYDTNRDGQMDMFVDQKGDGCACDIIPYLAADSNQDLPRNNPPQ